VTIVPASGLVGGGTAIDPTRLAAALTEGAVAGIAAVGGPPLTATPVQPLVAPPGAEAAGATAYEFDLVTGTASIKVRWVVEATLGSLLGGAIPVDAPAKEGPSVAPATLPELNRARVNGTGRDIQVLSDVSTTVSVEIAKGVLQVKDLIELTAGQVVELDREAGDPVDILVNGTLVAKGDIVVVGNQLGVRLIQIVEAV
jgi:flagellar motor switch protein FliN/FliY